MSKLDLKNVKWPDLEREKWEERLQKELKISDLKARHIILEPSIIYDPFKTKTAFEKRVIKSFPRLSYGQRFDLSDEKAQNSSILSLLKNDLRVVSLNANENTNWSEILNGVFLKLIHLDIHFSSIQAQNVFEAYKREHTQSDNWQVSSNLSSVIINLNYKDYEGLSQVELIQCALNDCAKVKADQIKVSLSIGEHLLKIIPFIRALRLAFESKFPDKRLFIEAECLLENISENKNDALIKAGSVYLFCTMAGIDHLYMHHLSDPSDLDHCRLLLNVQNMMMLESRVDDKGDTLSGSYVIEDLTHQFLSMVGV